MTVRIADIAPNEALLLELVDRFGSNAIAGETVSDQEIHEFLKEPPESLHALQTLFNPILAT